MNLIGTANLIGSGTFFQLQMATNIFHIINQTSEVKTIIHEIANTKIAEITENGILVNNAEDGLQLLVDIYYQDVDKIIIYKEQLSDDFFDLSTKLAGEILQKFANYRVRLAIVGQFTDSSQSLQDFIFESNKGKQVNFVSSSEEAIARFSA